MTRRRFERDRQDTLILSIHGLGLVTLALLALWVALYATGISVAWLLHLLALCSGVLVLLTLWAVGGYKGLV